MHNEEETETEREREEENSSRNNEIVLPRGHRVLKRLKPRDHICFNSWPDDRKSFPPPLSARKLHFSPSMNISRALHLFPIVEQAVKGLQFHEIRANEKGPSDRIVYVSRKYNLPGNRIEKIKKKGGWKGGEKRRRGRRNKEKKPAEYFEVRYFREHAIESNGMGSDTSRQRQSRPYLFPALVFKRATSTIQRDQTKNSLWGKIRLWNPRPRRVREDRRWTRFPIVPKTKLAL